MPGFTQPATIPVTVYDPAFFSQPSSALPFNVINPTPVLSALTPATVIAGAPAFDLNVAVTGLESASTVLVNGTSRTPFNTPQLGNTGLQLPLAAQDLASPGTLTVSVSNPAPGGGSSATQTLYLIAADNHLRTIALEADRHLPLCRPRHCRRRLGRRRERPGLRQRLWSRLYRPSRSRRRRLLSVVNVSGHDLAWDSTRRLLYRAVPATDPNHANTITAVDPVTLAITASNTFIGGPLSLASHPAAASCRPPSSNPLPRPPPLPEQHQTDPHNRRLRRHH